MKQMTLTAAISQFFGRKYPGQTNLEFLAELKALTDKDRADFVEMFKTVGIEINPLPQPLAA